MQRPAGWAVPGTRSSGMWIPCPARVIEGERQLAVDLAEQSLYACAAAGEGWAVQYLLSTQGRDRGNVTRRELTGPHGQPLPSASRNIVVLSGSKEEYISTLRALRDRACDTEESVPRDAMAGSLP
jgi:hypothetical protein